MYYSTEHKAYQSSQRGLTYNQLQKALELVMPRFSRVFVIRKGGKYRLYHHLATATEALSIGHSVTVYNRDENGVFQRNFA